jgi:hypothetical protein
MRVAPIRDTVRRVVTGSGAIKPMPKAEIAKAVQLLDLMLEFLPTYEGCPADILTFMPSG